MTYYTRNATGGRAPTRDGTRGESLHYLRDECVERRHKTVSISVAEEAQSVSAVCLSVRAETMVSCEVELLATVSARFNSFPMKVAERLCTWKHSSPAVWQI